MYFKLAIGNVRKSMRDYGIYFLTLVFGVCVFYAFNSMAAQNAVLNLSETQSQMIELLSTIIGGVSVFIAIILGFLMVYASRYLIRRRKKEFGTYLLLGMPPFKVSKIIVYETLLVGFLSLGVGLLLGVLFSQALLYVTAALFTVKMDFLVFVFSVEALIKTVVYFVLIYVVVLIFNVFSVSRYKLIDLINADKMNEGIKLRNIPLSIVLFIISLILIIFAYDQLLQNGLKAFDEQFLLATVLVCIGTLLFFYSLSGFILRAIQMSKQLYYKGLNMFKLRQLSAKINTAFVSISIVCMALFLAITSTCGGFSLGSSFTGNLSDNTVYDASLTSYLPTEDLSESNAEQRTPSVITMIEDDFDMTARLAKDIDNWDTLVKDTAQLNLYYSDLSVKEVFDNSDGSISNSLYDADMDSIYLEMVSLSDYNNLRALSGLEPVSLEDNTYLLWCTFDELLDMFSSYVELGNEVTIFGTTLKPQSAQLETTSSQTSSLSMNTGTLIVPDEVIAQSAAHSRTVLNVMYNGERSDIESSFNQALKTHYFDVWEEDSSLYGWPFATCLTAEETIEQSVGLSATIAYLAIYIGVVLVVACAAILALQQLSEAADNVRRYSLLKNLGVDNKMINRALITQIGIYFIFPLILALSHSIVALSVVTEVSSLYGHLDIFGPLIVTIALFLLVYGGYFLLTYFASRSMIHAKNAV